MNMALDLKELSSGLSTEEHVYRVVCVHAYVYVQTVVAKFFSGYA